MNRGYGIDAIDPARESKVRYKHLLFRGRLKKPDGESEYRRHFDTNVLGLLLATKTAVSQFGPEGESIVNIGSVASRQTPAGASIYTATKGAVDALRARFRRSSDRARFA